MQLIDVKAGRILPTTSVVNIYKSVILCVLGYLSHLCGVPIFRWLLTQMGEVPPFFWPRAGAMARGPGLGGGSKKGGLFPFG